MTAHLKLTLRIEYEDDHKNMSDFTAAITRTTVTLTRENARMSETSNSVNDMISGPDSVANLQQ